VIGAFALLSRNAWAGAHEAIRPSFAVPVTAR
jgi:hypothetical protein